MAGLDCGEVSSLAWDVLSGCIAAVATVSDDVVAPCMRLLANSPRRIVAGESAVAGLAAMLLGSIRHDLRSALKIDYSSRVLVFGTEGNTDPELYHSLIKENRVGGSGLLAAELSERAEMICLARKSDTGYLKSNLGESGAG